MKITASRAPRIHHHTRAGGDETMFLELDNLVLAETEFDNGFINAIQRSIYDQLNLPHPTFVGFGGIEDADWSNILPQHGKVIPLLDSPEIYGVINTVEVVGVKAWLDEHGPKLKMPRELRKQLTAFRGLCHIAVDQDGGLVFG